MSMTAVPISIRLVRAPIAASSGNGDPSWRAKWCTRKYAPSAPSSSAATARLIDCSTASDADRVCEPGDDDQRPNDRKPIFFHQRVNAGRPGAIPSAKKLDLPQRASRGTACRPGRGRLPAEQPERAGAADRLITAVHAEPLVQALGAFLGR